MRANLILYFEPLQALHAGYLPAFRPLQAQLCHQVPARQNEHVKMNMSEAEREELLSMQRSRTMTVGQVRQARLILLLDEEASRAAIMNDCDAIHQ